MKEQTIRNDISHIKRLFNPNRKYVRPIEKDDLQAINNVFSYINHLNKVVLKNNKVAIKLILSIVMDEVLKRGKTGLEAFAEVEQRVELPLEAIFESIEEETPFIQFDQILSNQQYREMFEIKEIKYVFVDEGEREKHNDKIIERSLKKIRKAFDQDNSKFRDSLQKRAVEIIAKYSN